MDNISTTKSENVTEVPFDLIRNIIFPIRDATMFLSISSGNMIVIIAVAKYPHLRTGTNFLIANLSCSDLMIGFCSFINIWKWMCGFDENPIAQVYCMVNMSFYTVSVFLSVFNLLAIAVDRLVAVKYPFAYRSKTNEKRITVYIVLTWVAAGSYGIIAIFGRAKWPHECNIEKSFTKMYLLSVGITVLVVEVILVCIYLSIYRKIHASSEPVSNNNRNVNSIEQSVPLRNGVINGTRVRNRDKTMTKIVAIVTIVFVFCFTPFSISLVILAFSGDEFEKSFYKVRGAFIFIALLNSVVNPIIYGLTNSTYRAAFSGVIHCRKTLETRDSTSECSIDALS